MNIKLGTHYLSRNIKKIVVLLFFVLQAFLLFLLIVEYRFYRSQSQELRSMKDRYHFYLEMIKKKIIEKQGRLPEYCCRSDLIEEKKGVSPDSVVSRVKPLVVLDRSGEYLKQSTLRYLKDQQLESLCNQINVTQWGEYTEEILTNAQKEPVLTKPVKKRAAKKPTPKKTPSVVPRYINTKTMHGKPKYTYLQGMFSWPISPLKFWISSLFGPRKTNGTNGFHYGIDMAALKGTPVMSARGGKIVQARFESGYGNTVVIMHDAVYKTRYAHLHTINVRSGQRVGKGVKIGTVGDTGHTIKSGRDASHLHFEVYEKSKQVNPLYFLPT